MLLQQNKYSNSVGNSENNSRKNLIKKKENKKRSSGLKRAADKKNTDGANSSHEFIHDKKSNHELDHDKSHEDLHRNVRRTYAEVVKNTVRAKNKMHKYKNTHIPKHKHASHTCIVMCIAVMIPHTRDDSVASRTCLHRVHCTGPIRKTHLQMQF